jgi:hypothetical protein
VFVQYFSLNKKKTYISCITSFLIHAFKEITVAFQADRSRMEKHLCARLTSNIT